VNKPGASLLLAAAVAESALASRYLGAQREETGVA
jgi:hypothetical protein